MLIFTYPAGIAMYMYVNFNTNWLVY